MEEDKTEHHPQQEHHQTNEIHTEHPSYPYSTGKFSEIREKSIIWLKDPYNLLFVGIMILAIGIRLYYFWLARNQPLWWDEVCYGILAKNFIVDTWRNNSLVLGELTIRPLFFSLMWAFFILLKIPEIVSRFILEIIPSIISVLLVYLISKEVFNKKIALVSAFIFSVIWIQLFYSLRFLTDNPSLFFLLASLYFFIKSRSDKFNYKYFLISLLFLSLGTLTKFQIGIMFFVYLIILILEKNLFLNKPKFWYSGIFGVFPILVFFTINYYKSGNIFPALLGGSYITPGEEISSSFAWGLLNYIPIFLGTTFFIFFILGLFIILFKLSISFNLILKDKKSMNYLLLILVMVTIFSFFIFYVRSAEDRYFLPATITLASFSGVGICFISDYIKKYSKIFSIIFILFILGFGGYYQLKQANEIISSRKDSFLQIKQAAEWAKDNIPKESVIVAAGLDPYFIYYSNLLTVYYNETQIEEKKNADYLIVHVFPPPNYLNNYISENQDNWTPISGFFLDKQKQQPGLIIFKNKNK